jgi:hypothetical protein
MKISFKEEIDKKKLKIQKKSTIKYNDYKVT